MDKPKFVYVLYIATSPEKVWEALTSGDFAEKYWGGSRLTSDWKVGSPVQLIKEGDLQIEGEVLRFEPPRLLSYTFHEPGVDEPPSRVVFELDTNGATARLTVTHDELPADGKTLGDISGGWPLVLSSMKSLLESGSPLAYEHHCVR